MVTMLERTVKIGADRRVLLDVTAPENVPPGNVGVVLLLLSEGEASALESEGQKVPSVSMGENGAGFAGQTKSPSVEAMLAEAGKKWAYNRAHPGEIRAAFQKLRGSLSPNAFGGMDGVTYQRMIRDEWDD